MNSFEYASPRTTQAAVQLLGSDAVILAGGTDLLSLMKEGVATPKRVVNIKEIRELGGISLQSDGTLRIGALVTLDELIEDGLINQHCPSLVQASMGVRSPQIQSVGTVAGDLCQRPRCWYYRRGYGLLALKDGKSMVVDGDNRYHAILGNEGPAYFVNPSSLAPALVALQASVKIVGPEGERVVEVSDFFRIPKQEGEKENVLSASELVSEIHIPSVEEKKNATYEVREKEALDWPLAAAAVAMTMDGNTVVSARVALGHVAPVPWLSEAAGGALAGKEISAESADAVGQAAVEMAKALSKNSYKIRLARVAAKRAVLRAAGMEV